MNSPVVEMVGIGGRDRSGKDTLAELYIERGYFGFSLGDAVRQHSRVRHADTPDPISVRNMTETSNWLRAEYGPDVILRQALDEYEKATDSRKKYKGVVLYSVRMPVEVDFILAHGGKVVWVEASDSVRYQRKLASLREGEVKVSLEEMLSQEKLQLEPQPGVPIVVQMNLDYVKKHASEVIENNGEDKDSFKKIAEQQLDLR